MKRNISIYVVLAGIALLIVPPDANAQTLHVRLYPDNPDFLEVVLDASGIASNEFIWNVKFDVDLRKEQGQRVEGSYQFAGKPLQRGVYRNFISHGHTLIREASGREFVYTIGVGGGKADEFKGKSVRKPANTGKVQAAGVQTLVAAPAKKQKPKPKISRRFNKPGFQLDWCLYYGKQCGRAAADYYCKAMGYQRAKSFAIAKDIGKQHPTFVIGDRKVCREQFCDGFAYINCER